MQTYLACFLKYIDLKFNTDNNRYRRNNNMEALQILNNEEFQNTIQDGVTLLDFNAPWCAPCRAQSPILKELAEKYQGKAVIAEMNIDENQEEANRLGIRSIPTLAVFKDGEEVERFVGLQTGEALSGAIEKALE
jgi:thioredoxin 1